MNAPRILMTTDTVGGVWRYAIELCSWLADRGATVHLATMGARMTRPQRREARAIPRLSVHESEFRLEWMDDPWEDVERAGTWLLEREAEARPDVVHVNGYTHGALAWRAPCVVVAHSCVESWFRAVKGEPAPVLYARYRRSVRRGLSAAAAVVAPTSAMLHALEEAYGPVWTGRVIPNGVRGTHAAPATKEPFVLSAGRVWDPAKNIAALEAAAPRVSWPIFVAGSSVEPGGASRAERRVAGARVHALGPLAHADLMKWMARAAIYALPAYYEPFGLSVLEAALCGCALVLGDIPSLRETWGGAALFIDPADPEMLAATLTRVIDDRALCAELALRARSRAMRFSADRMGAGYLSLYQELTERVPLALTGASS